MNKETRTVVYDDELRIEAYRFEGIVQPFPNHFHEHYVIGFVEGGQRTLSCRNRDYSIEHGNVVLLIREITTAASRTMMELLITEDLIFLRVSCLI